MKNMAVLELEGSRRSWKRAAQLGTVLIILGIVTLSAILNSRAVPVELVGWLLVLSGMAEAVHACRVRRSDAFLFHLVPGVAAVPIGLLTATHPGARAITWMLMFASFFTVIGLFRAIAAYWLKFPNWGWTVLEAMATLALGSVMWAAWVWLIPWFLSFAAGLSMILRGGSSLMLAQGLRRLNRQRRGESRRHEEEMRHRQTSRFAAN